MSDSETVVVRIEGGDAWLQVCGREACGQCESAQGCGLGGHREPRLQRVRNTVGARVGDTVIVSVPEGAVLKAALMSYFVPLLLIIVATAVGTAVAADRGAIAGAAVGLAAGWAWLRFAGARLAGRREPLLSLRLRPEPVHLHRNSEP